MSVPFGLFRRKESEAPAELPAIVVPSPNSLSISQALNLLRDVESAQVQELAARLAPVKESATKSLNVINNIANNMEHEKIKLEGIEQRFKSVAENSRRTVVSSLKRESSAELILPQSANDAKKFKERFETMMNRLSEVSGSHSRVITAFMKKHANKMNGEFDTLKKLFNETKSLMSDFELQRSPIVKCSGILNTTSQKVSSIRSTELSLQNIEREIDRIENEIKSLQRELGELKSTPEFDRATAIVQKLNEIARQEEQSHSQLTALFSRVSRAFTKYSYGLTKETEARLQMMTDEPWRILYKGDISPYSSLLIEIRKSIDSGKIQLKDSDKILDYLDDIVKSLPEFQSRVQALKAAADLMRQSDIGVVNKANKLQDIILEHEEELAKNRQNLEQQRRHIEEKNNEVSALLREAGDILGDLTGRKYTLEC